MNCMKSNTGPSTGGRNTGIGVLIGPTEKVYLKEPDISDNGIVLGLNMKAHNRKV